VDVSDELESGAVVLLELWSDVPLLQPTRASAMASAMNSAISFFILFPPKILL
jgi:hypothetical protein